MGGQWLICGGWPATYHRWLQTSSRQRLTFEQTQGPSAGIDWNHVCTGLGLPFVPLVRSPSSHHGVDSSHSRAALADELCVRSVKVTPEEGCTGGKRVTAAAAKCSQRSEASPGRKRQLCCWPLQDTGVGFIFCGQRRDSPALGICPRWPGAVGSALARRSLGNGVNETHPRGVR